MKQAAKAQSQGSGDDHAGDDHADTSLSRSNKQFNNSTSSSVKKGRGHSAMNTTEDTVDAESDNDKSSESEPVEEEPARKKKKSGTKSVIHLIVN